MKSVRIRSYFGPYFPSFGPNTKRYGASFRIQSKCGKIRTRISPNRNNFHAVDTRLIGSECWVKHFGVYIDGDYINVNFDCSFGILCKLAMFLEFMMYKKGTNMKFLYFLFSFFML